MAEEPSDWQWTRGGDGAGIMVAVSEEVAGGRKNGDSPWLDRSGKWEAMKKELTSFLPSGISSSIFSSFCLHLSPSMAPCLHTGERSTKPQTHLPKEDHFIPVATGRAQLCKKGPVHSFLHLFTQQILMTHNAPGPVLGVGERVGSRIKSQHSWNLDYRGPGDQKL